MSKDIGRETLLNASPISKTGLVLAQPLDISNPDADISKLYKSLCLPVVDNHIFEIGEKCFVGGTRSGVVAYVGETHFAPGEWIGVVLDEPSGKNDGCVSGKRYFQCDQKRGVFSRANRLTLSPIEVPKRNLYDIDSYENNQFRRSVSPSPSISSTTCKTPNRVREIQVGDRVIVSSGFGSRLGVLKFIGETKFAAGNWCGVQLDEPNGKNDGSIDGVKYFDCPSKYGVFVPIAKVSVSPSTRKSTLSRAGSKESLGSVGTLNSVATTNTSRLRMSRLKKPTASSLGMIPQNSSHKIMSKSTYSMQDLIREKQQHIEKLMKERELDRDDLHNQILFFQKTICELNEKINILEIKLNDSERKNDELQNTVDDVTFCGDELNIQNQECRENIEILQKILIQHGIEFEPFIHSTTTNTCLKCINYSKKVEELSANLTNLKTEIENQKSNNNKSISETDFIAKEDELYKKELKISELENVIITLKHEKEIREIDLEDFKIQIETLNINKLEEINHTKTLVNDLKTGNANLQNKKISNDEKFLMEDQIHFLKKKIKDKQSEIENLKLGQENGALEITSMKKNFEKLVQEIQSKENYLKESQHKCDLLTNLLNDAKQQNKSDENELQNIIEKNIEKIKTYNEKEFESIKTFETLNIEKDNALKKNEEIATKLFELTGKIETLENELKGKESELSILQQNYETIKTQKLDLYNENIQYQSKIFQNNQKLDSLSQEVQHLKLALDKSNVEFKKLEDSCNTTQNLLTETTLSKDKNICVLEDNINILTSENKNLSKSNIELNEIIKCLQDSQTSYKEKLNHKMLELTASIEEKESYVKELRHKTEQLEVLMTEIAQSKLLLEEKTKTLSEMEKKNLLFEQNTNDLLEKIQDLKLKQFETQNILTKELNDSKFNNEMLTQSLNDLQRKMQEESDVIKTKDVKIINLISQLKNLEIKLASSIKRKESGDDELKKLAIEMNKGDVESKEIQLIEKEKKIEDLGQTIQNLQHEKLNLEKNGHELKKKVEHSYALNKELQCQINDFTNQMKKLHEQIDVVTNDKNLSEKIIIEVKKQLVNLQIEKETLQNSLKNLHIIQENTEKRSKEIDDCMSKKEFDLCEKNKKIHNLQSEIFRLMDKLNEVQNNFENLSNNFEAQKHEIDFSENKIKNLEKILEKESGSLNNKTIEIEELKFELKNLTEQNETLNGRLILNTQSKIELINKIEQVEKNLNLTEQKLKLAENLNQLNLTKLKENSLELGVAKESQKKAKILEQEQNNEISFLTKKICELTEIKSATDESFNQMKIKISEVEKEKQCIFDQNEKLQAINSNSNVLDEEHENLKDQLKTKSLELEKVLEAYKVEKSENKNIAKMYREETEDLNKKIKFCEKEIFELQQHNMNLTQEKLQLERRYLIEQKPDSEDIKNLKDELLKEKDNYLILSNKYQKLIVDLRTLENSYKILQDLEQKTLDLQHINDMLHEENYKMKHDIGKVELQKQDAINNAELLEFKNGKEVEKYKQLTIHSQEEATNLHKQIKIKDKELSDITYLYEISHKNILEKAVHNEKLEKEIQTLKNSIVNTDYISKNSAAQISSNIISDSDAADQINFLNSIIADMHRTNETLKARIDVLETNPADISKHFNLDILNKRKPTPRLFCDICDEFDKHDTEYCPLQSSDSPPSSLSNINNLTIQNDKVNKRVILSPREYCENCEIFGHDTSSCPNVECF